MFENGYEDIQDSSYGAGPSAPYVDMADQREMQIFNQPSAPDSVILQGDNGSILQFDDVYAANSRYDDNASSAEASALSQRNFSPAAAASESGPSQTVVQWIAKRFAENFTGADSSKAQDRAVQELFDDAAAVNTTVHDMNRAINNALQEQNSRLSISTASNAPDKITVNEQQLSKYTQETYDNDKSAWHQGVTDFVNMVTPTMTRDEIAQEFAQSMHTNMSQSETQDVVQKAFDHMKALGLDSMDMVGAINKALKDIGSDLYVGARSDKPDSFIISTPERAKSESETFQDHYQNDLKTSNDESSRFSTDNPTDELASIDKSTLAQYIPTEEQPYTLNFADNELLQEPQIDISALLADIPAFDFGAFSAGDQWSSGLSLMSANDIFQSFTMPDLSGLDLNINFGFSAGEVGNGGLGEEVYG